jgi:hypothetical protein
MAPTLRKPQRGDFSPIHDYISVRDFAAAHKWVALRLRVLHTRAPTHLMLQENQDMRCIALAGFAHTHTLPVQRNRAQ